MAVLAITMFGGITLLASQDQYPAERPGNGAFAACPDHIPVVGRRESSSDNPLSNPLWLYIQIATALILVLAANTAFSDFPRLSYFLARDKFMPHQYSFRGDRLAFSWGIVTLAILACILLIAFNGDTTALIPLYTVGVFNSFTLSQAGMVKRWWTLRTPGLAAQPGHQRAGCHCAPAIVLIISAVHQVPAGRMDRDRADTDPDQRCSWRSTGTTGALLQRWPRSM